MTVKRSHILDKEVDIGGGGGSVTVGGVRKPY